MGTARHQPNLYPRHLTQRLLDALADTPVVAVHGARQTGKSTLAQSLISKRFPATYVTLDNLAALDAAKRDPTGFLAGFDGPVILDEVQRAPKLLLAIKAEVDRRRRPGRFLLTGSAHVLALPQLADALAGRMETLTLWPLSQGELSATRETFLDNLFQDRLSCTASKEAGISRDLLDRIIRGGFPEVVGRAKAERRSAWFDAYLNTLLQRDIRDLSKIAGFSELPRLLDILAARASGLLNLADLARDAGLNQVTLKRYFDLLNGVYLAQTAPAWHTNRIKRLMKAPKLYLTDTGILAHLLGFTRESAGRDSKSLGALLENFVVMELRKQQGWSNTRVGLFHLRHYSGAEVDIVLEAVGSKKVVGIEVKASATPQLQDFKALREMKQALGQAFHRGVMLYTGLSVVPYAENLHAVPIANLWSAS